MNDRAGQRSEDFLKIRRQFSLGALLTEASHPRTANLSDVARQNVAAALRQLFEVDGDVLETYRRFAQSGRAVEMAEVVLRSLKQGGRIFFTGCGATGRLSILLDALWRDFWKRNPDGSARLSRPTLKGRQGGGAADWEQRTFSVMAGGDYALIKSVEGFEDIAAFGRKQLRDLGVRASDVVFAITEGGETSFVIGTAWEGAAAGATVYFVYNNPDEILSAHLQRSREILADRRVQKLNLTTGPMAVSGSTRMQATTIQLCVLLTVLEMVARRLGRAGRAAVSKEPARPDRGADPDLSGDCPAQFLAALERLHADLQAPDRLASLAKLVLLEEAAARTGHKINYFADRLAIDVLTDTTERSPTFCTPPFRKFDDRQAAESWAFLFVPQRQTPLAWRHLLKRQPRCLEWSQAQVRELVGPANLPRTLATLRKIGLAELLRFRIGLDGLSGRQPKAGDGAIAVGADERLPEELEAAQKAGATTGWIQFSRIPAGLAGSGQPSGMKSRGRLQPAASVLVPVSTTPFLLDGLTHVAAKLVLNALSTCTMVRLGRVMGNCMVWVVPSNLKLIDRATRYIAQLTGRTYEASNRLLFEALEYVEPRMQVDQAYPPVVGLAVLRARESLTNQEAELRLARLATGWVGGR